MEQVLVDVAPIPSLRAALAIERSLARIAAGPRAVLRQYAGGAARLQVSADAPEALMAALTAARAVLGSDTVHARLVGAAPAPDPAAPQRIRAALVSREQASADDAPSVMGGAARAVARVLRPFDGAQASPPVERRRMLARPMLLAVASASVLVAAPVVRHSGRSAGASTLPAVVEPSRMQDPLQPLEMSGMAMAPAPIGAASPTTTACEGIGSLASPLTDGCNVALAPRTDDPPLADVSEGSDMEAVTPDGADGGGTVADAPIAADTAGGTSASVEAPAPSPQPVSAGPVAATGLGWPLVGRITSLYSPAHPLGIDIAANTGDAMVAAADGRVVVAAADEGYGYYLLIEHAGGYATLYAHMMRPAEVGAGDSVRRGQVIGYAGNTGRSTGPHLHLEVRYRGMIMDPLNALPRIPLVIDANALRPATLDAPPPPALAPSATPSPTPSPIASATLVPEATPTSSPVPPVPTAPVRTPGRTTAVAMPETTAALPAPATAPPAPPVAVSSAPAAPVATAAPAVPSPAVTVAPPRPAAPAPTSTVPATATAAPTIAAPASAPSTIPTTAPAVAPAPPVASPTLAPPTAAVAVKPATPVAAPARPSVTPAAPTAGESRGEGAGSPAGGGHDGSTQSPTGVERG